MKARNISTILAVVISMSTAANGAVHYVDVNSATPESPYDSWSKAARTIQEAIDAADPGDEIIVTNGVYSVGGKAVRGSLINRVAVDKPLLLHSVNGPETTVIEGFQVPDTVIGDAAVRCAYLTNGAALSGFTLSNGATAYGQQVAQLDSIGGGICCESTNAVISNCVFVANASSSFGGGACYGTLLKCKFTNNWTVSYGGGGAAYAVLADCTLTRNRTGQPNYGAGAYECILSNCIVAANTNGGVKYSTADDCVILENQGTGVRGGLIRNSIICSNQGGFSSLGGGVREATLTNCIIFANQGGFGGGAYDCTLTDCVISNNSASSLGGGAYWGFLNDCTVSGNFSAYDGGGTCGGTNKGCLILDNVAVRDGGGAWRGSVDGCVVSANAAGGNGGGIYNASTSPGDNVIFENNSAGGSGGGYYSSAIISRSLTNWVFIGNSAGADGGGMRASFGQNVFLVDCTFVSNSAVGNGGGLAASGGMFIPSCTNCWFGGNTAGADGGGAHSVDLTRCTLINNSAASGGGALAGRLSDCVITGNRASTNGGGAHVSGSAVSANNIFSNNSAPNGGAVYSQTSPFSNCVFVANQAAFGGACYGGRYHKCSITDNTASISGGGAYDLDFGGFLDCIVSANSAALSGGGAYGCNLTNCTVSANQAGHGGGAANSSLTRCVLRDNRAITNGGGAYNSTLINCLLTRNAASWGGGFNGTGATLVNNCTIAGNVATNSGGGVYRPTGSIIRGNIVYFNSAASDPDYYGSLSSCFNCCINGAPPLGTGTITNNPLLVDPASGNFRLRADSPCINTGSGTPGSTDLDARPRLVSTIDMGAYEFQGAGMSEFIGWLELFGLPVNGSADYTDPDSDRLNNWEEWRADTSPTNELSVLRLLNPAEFGFIAWKSVANRSYSVERSTNLGVTDSFVTLATNILGSDGTTTYTDTNAAGPGPFFYRVGVE